MRKLAGPILCATLLVLGACEKKGGGAGGAAGGAQGTSGAMTLMPAELDTVVGINAARIGKSPIMQRLIKTAGAEATAAIDRARTECKMDPWNDVSTVTIGIAQQREQFFAVVNGKLGSPELVACSKKIFAEEGATVEETKHASGKTMLKVHEQGGDPVWIAFMDANTIIASSSETWVNSAFDPKLEKADKNAALQGLIGRANKDAAIWAVAPMPPEAGAQISAGTGGKVKGAPKSAVAAIDVSDKITLDVKIDMADDADAKGMVEVAQPQLAQMAPMAQGVGLGQAVGRVKLTNEGNIFRIQADLTEQEIAEVEKQLANFQ